jgi:D-glycero-alpha-D-manno-heptose-7-phosphate kinase
MIISRTPFRISLAGGGTDYPAWYREHGGATIGFALNRYCYLTVRHLPPFFDHRTRLVYSRIENVMAVSEIHHPAARAVLTELGVEGLEIHHDGDLPHGAGIGSSSAFTVGLINAIYALQGKRIDKATLAARAIRIEQDVIGECVGSQDQVFAAHGGFIRIDFSDEAIVSEPVIMTPARRCDLLDHLVLYFTGFQRQASDMARQQVANFPARQLQLMRMRAMVDEAEAILCGGNPIDLGELLHEGWQLKRGLAAGVSTSYIDEMYDAARRAGALGGKLLGAGGGGFMLFLIRPERRSELRTALPGLVEVDVGIDNDGSRIVLFEPNGWSER